MAHFALFLNSLSAACSLVAFGAFLFIYRAGRSPLVKSYLLFIGVSLVQLFVVIAGLYASLSFGIGARALTRLYYFSATIATALEAYVFPRFFLEFADIAFAGGKRRLVIGLCSVVLASSPLVLLPESALPLNFLPPTAGLALFLGAMLYSQVKLIGAYPRIKDKIGRIGVPAIVAYNLVCIVAGVMDSLASGPQLALGIWPYGYLLQPSISIGWAILSLAWAFAYEGSGTLARPASVEPDVARAKKLGLTERELELARLLASGAANKEMAAALGLSPNTVRNHVHNIYEKTGSHNRVELVRALCGADEDGASPRP
jgi:Response regulator containing a CheY-like receiver domain and an HTH DNA-binding domain